MRVLRCAASRPISGLEGGAAARRAAVTLQHRPFDRRRDIAPRILQHGRKIVGRVAGHRILEIEEPEMRNAAAALDQHDVLGMEVPQYGDGPRPSRVIGSSTAVQAA
jgi:hypothetical protein